MAGALPLKAPCGALLFRHVSSEFHLHPEKFAVCCVTLSTKELNSALNWLPENKLHCLALNVCPVAQMSRRGSS